MIFYFAVAIAAIAAGGIASIAGFGIGSILTPLVAMQYGMKTAVAAVSIPHVIATVVRFWKLRAHVNRTIFLQFGLMNAAGALIGAVIHFYVTNPVLGVVLGVLLVFVGLMGVLGYTENLRFGRKGSWIAGAVSGGFGGLVGNQGGIRSAAMLGLGVKGPAFVATATAIGLAVDAVRIPVYLASEWRRMVATWPVVLAAVLGVLVGTLIGERVLRWIPEKLFRKVVSAILLVIGILLLVFQE
ncbi:MAG: TSUP family transporter [Bryobacteraceae bacterium]